MHSRIVAAVDIGGTKVAAALVNPLTGEILTQRQDPTNTGSPQAFVDGVAGALAKVLDQAPSPFPAAIGVGTAGHVDTRTGQLTSLNLRQENLPLRDLLQERFHLPVAVDNDANVGALAEMAYGGARGNGYLAYVAVGTGIGLGLVLEGRLYNGKANFAGELGHVTVDYHGSACKCGGRGCLEEIASGSAVVRRAKECVARGKATILRELCGGDLNQVTGELVVEAVKQGDADVRGVVEEAACALGYALRSLINILDLEVIILGGGFPFALPQLFLETIRSVVYAENRVNRSHCPVILSELGDKSTLLGAAYLAAQQAGIS
ncbi:MAG TPA: ROK family protein [Limnochordia bacterium]|jgi:glucokinase|nr:ROK family protein [Limnochordia bacterium]